MTNTGVGLFGAELTPRPGSSHSRKRGPRALSTQGGESSAEPQTEGRLVCEAGRPRLEVQSGAVEPRAWGTASVTMAMTLVGEERARGWLPGLVTRHSSQCSLESCAKGGGEAASQREESTGLNFPVRPAAGLSLGGSRSSGGRESPGVGGEWLLGQEADSRGNISSQPYGWGN